ncbi:MAG: NPCBM/NEW2 domain-containing protein [Oscillospiraceae bacterium]|nr:NPCBM/NEW2 domain-containing protein [Oscillospiraceae bacterium]
MRKAIHAKREKLKWLAALCVCLLCFSMCLGLLARPTLADAPVFLDDLERIGALRWDDTSRSTRKDSFGDMHMNSISLGGAFAEKAGVLGWARYRLENAPDGKIAAISGRIACAETGTADAALRLVIYGDNEGAAPLYTSETIRRDTKPFEFRVDISGQKTMKMELVQMDAPNLPEGQASSAYALLSEVMLMHEPAVGLPAALQKLIPLESSWAMAPLAHIDSLNATRFGARLGGTLDAAGTMGVMGSARYQLDKKYSRFTGSLVCAKDGAENAVMQVKFYADGSATPFYTSAQIKRSTQPIPFTVDVNGVNTLKIELVGTTDPVAAAPQSGWVLLYSDLLELTATQPTSTTVASTSLPGLTYQPVPGWVGLYWRFTAPQPGSDGVFYSFTRQPQTDPLLLHVYAKPPYPEVKGIGDVQIHSMFGLLNNSVQFVAATLKGAPSQAEPITLGGYSFSLPYNLLMVISQDRLYTLAEAFQRGILTKEAIAALVGHINNVTPPVGIALITPTSEWALQIRENILESLKSLEPEFYVNALKNNVYLLLKRDGTADFNAAIWAGPDNEIGTADDKVLTLRSGSYFYEESAGVWKFVVSRFDYVDPRWAAQDAVTTTAAPTTTAPATSGSTGSVSPTTTTAVNGFLTTGQGSIPPKTGVPMHMGLLLCVAALFMACVYCGYRLFRKERA